MTRYEQIEEMAKIMFGHICTRTKCDSCKYPNKQKDCEAYRNAEQLYNAGYRKVLLDTENGKMVDCEQYAPWQLIKGYTEREVNKTRKETAKELLQELFNEAVQYGKTTVGIEWMAQKYGVEVK